MRCFHAFTLFLFSLLILTGCATNQVWVKPGATQSEFYRVQSGCEAMARGATPMDYSSSGSSTTYHSGSVYGSDGSYGTYSGSSTTTNTNIGQAMGNLGQSIARKRMFENCMRGQGFELRGVTTGSYSADHYITSGNTASSGKNPTTSEPGDPSKFQQPLDTWDEGPTPINFARITKNRAELKLQPALKSSDIEDLTKGTVVEVLGEAAYSWFKISHVGKTGFIMKRWAEPTNNSPEGEIISESEAEDRLRRKNENYYAWVSVEDGALRSGPGHDAILSEILKEGTQVIVLNSGQGKWIKVRSGSTSGYIHESSITFGNK